jgi:hypothetical protein
MATIKNTDINNANSSVFTIGSNAKLSTKLTNYNLDTKTKNDVAAGSLAKPINLENLKSAIKTLEQNFSNNCCQAQCNATSTKSSCQVCQYTSSACQSQCSYSQCTQNYYYNYYNDGL